MISFGMTSTILTFKDKYYVCNGKVQALHKGLTIGGYESAWLADLAMSYLLDKHMTNAHFNNTIFAGIYRDDGIIILNSKFTIE